ncbi:MAG: efflux RND transporter periplasmic adaptor subunit [Mariniblastus sp.]
MNAATQVRPKSKWGWLRIVINVIVCVAILAGAAGAIIVINRTEPTAQKINSTRKSAALVETITVERGDFSPRLAVLGTVESAQQISLSPRVSGQVIELAPEFAPGGMVTKGDLLLRIDPADFENALSISKSELEQAEASMEIELARQRLAEKELKLLEGSIDGTNRGLVMREPQIASIKAQVSAARAAVERAQLNLERAEIFAPFDAQVLNRLVNVGSQVRLGDELGQLIGLEEYWVMAAVPVRSLRWVQFPIAAEKNTAIANAAETNNVEKKNVGQTNSPAGSIDATDNDSDGTAGSTVILRNQDAWGPGVEREARVSRLIGTLDQQSRLARVLIIVDDPLGQTSDNPPMILNTLIETEIKGKLIKDVIRLPRAFVRDQDTVWVMKDEKLEIRETEVVFSDADYAYIRTGLESGDEIVTTTLATVAEGVGLRKTNQAVDVDDADVEALKDALLKRVPPNGGKPDFDREPETDQELGSKAAAETSAATVESAEATAK